MGGRAWAAELGYARSKGLWAPHCPFLGAWGQPAPLQVSKAYLMPLLDYSLLFLRLNLPSDKIPPDSFLGTTALGDSVPEGGNNGR